MGYFYYRRRTSRHVIHSNKPKTIEDRHSKPADSQYTGFDRSSHQTSESPVYENFRERPSDITATRHYSNMDSPTEPGDLYVQCDSEHDAIYSNDPTFNYRNQPDNCEEDVYIVPDA
ncbi:hypothetical protein AALO_G00002550 [Alosa alosa]|uniref:Uncharacterized protein n=1 Tax=Alosa alosa TaxID=278164 RepID=A0AAV6HDI9_9TELE|nr:hypothetical protein AALO_G00002550 [Alosa alosa]